MQSFHDLFPVRSLEDNSKKHGALLSLRASLASTLGHALSLRSGRRLGGVDAARVLRVRPRAEQRVDRAGFL